MKRKRFVTERQRELPRRSLVTSNTRTDFFLQPLQMSSRPLLVITVLLLLNTMLFHWQASTQSVTIDFFSTWAIGQSLKLNPRASIYERETQNTMASVLQHDAGLPDSSQQQRLGTVTASRLYDNGMGEVVGTPLLYAIISFLSSGHYDTDRELFIICSSLSFIAAIVILCYLLRFSLLATALAAVFFSAYYSPIVSDMRVGNINQIQLLLVSLVILSMAKFQPFLAGLILAIGIMLKPNIALVSVAATTLYCVDKRYEKVLSLFLGGCVGMAISLVASVGYCGAGATWSEFLKSLPRTLGLAQNINDGNYALPAVIYRATKMRPSLVIFCVLLASMGCTMVLTRRRCSSGGASAESDREMEPQRALHDAFAAGGLGCAIMLLSANLIWLHYYVLLIPTCLYLIRPVTGTRSRTSAEVVTAGLALVALLMLSTFGEHVGGRALYQAVLTDCAGIVMVALGLREMWVGRRWSVRRADE